MSHGLTDKSSEHLCGLILCILSIFEMSEEKENVFFEQLCPRLLELCQLGILSRQHLFLSIVSRKRLKLARIFIEVEDRTFERSAISETEKMKDVCGKIINSDGCISIEEIFLSLIKMDKHWIEDFVVSYLKLFCFNF